MPVFTINGETAETFAEALEIIRRVWAEYKKAAAAIPSLETLAEAEEGA